MKIIDRKDAINRRLYNNQSLVETAIYRTEFRSQESEFRMNSV
ncbi:MAG: hypothetical protein V7K39_20610 [Nostoc sp.]